MSRVNNKDKTQTDANSLSIKLLKTIGENSGEVGSKKVITNLRDLSNRIKIANKQHENKHPTKTAADEWIRQEGVDLTLVREQARFIKEEEKKMSVRTIAVAEDEPNALEPSLKDAQFDEFLQKVEEKQAYRAIFSSLSRSSVPQDSASQPRSHMKKLIKTSIDRLCGYQINEKSFNTSMASKQSKTESDLEQIKAYQECLQKSSLSQLRHNIFNRFHSSSNWSKKWVSLVFYQIQIAKQVYDSEDSGNEGSLKNYLSAVALDELQQLYCELLKSKGDLLQKYRLDENYHESEGRWSQLYFLLRKGEKESFIRQCQEISKDLAEIYKDIFQKIGLFHKPESMLTDITANEAHSLFERIIKLIALGKYEKVFKDVSPSLQAFEDPWFILMTIGFEQFGSRSEFQRKKMFKEAAGSYFKNMTAKIFMKENIQEQSIINFMIGLVSLGCFKQLFMFYDRVGDYLHGKPLYIDFVHLFIMLAANPEVIFCHYSDKNDKKETTELLMRCLLEMVGYLKYLKGHREGAFKQYFSLLLQILLNIELLNTRFPLKQLIESLCFDLFTRVEDLKLISRQALFAMDGNSQVSKIFQKELINSVHPVEEKEYVELANFCAEIGQIKLQQVVLIKMIIFNYFQTEKEMEQNGSFGDPFKNRSSEKQEVKYAESYLESSMKYEDRTIFDFLMDLKELRGWVLNRRKDVLHRNQPIYSRYRQNFEEVLAYLIDADPSGKIGLLEIFLLYVQRLYQMYRLIHLSSSNLSKFYQQRDSLAGDLNLLGQRYPVLEGETYGRVMEMLCR